MDSYWDNHKSLWDELDNDQPEHTEAKHTEAKQPVNDVPALLKLDTLAIKKFHTYSDEYAIEDDEGNVVGNIHKISGGLRQFFFGPRRFEVRDTEGTLVFVINDLAGFSLDRYEILYPDKLNTEPRQLAEITCHYGAFRNRFVIAIPGYSGVKIDTDFANYNAWFEVDSEEIAQITRIRLGMNGLFKSEKRYELDIEADVSPDLHAAIIGTAIVIDLAKQKED